MISRLAAVFMFLVPAWCLDADTAIGRLGSGTDHDRFIAASNLLGEPYSPAIWKALVERAAAEKDPKVREKLSALMESQLKGNPTGALDLLLGLVGDERRPMVQGMAIIVIPDKWPSITTSTGGMLRRKLDLLVKSPDPYVRNCARGSIIRFDHAADPANPEIIRLAEASLREKDNLARQAVTGPILTLIGSLGSHSGTTCVQLHNLLLESVNPGDSATLLDWSNQLSMTKALSRSLQPSRDFPQVIQAIVRVGGDEPQLTPLYTIAQKRPDLKPQILASLSSLRQLARKANRKWDGNIDALAKELERK